MVRLDENSLSLHPTRHGPSGGGPPGGLGGGGGGIHAASIGLGGHRGSIPRLAAPFLRCLENEAGPGIRRDTKFTEWLRFKTHPFVASYINKGWFNNQRRTWAKEFGCKLVVEEDTTYHMLQYRFLTKDRKVITT